MKIQKEETMAGKDRSWFVCQTKVWEEKRAAYFLKEKGFRILYAPYREGGNDFYRFLRSTDEDKFYEEYPFRVRPVTDDNPFFFNYTKVEDIIRLPKETLYWLYWVGQTILFYGLFLILLLSVIFIFLPLLVCRIKGKSISGKYRFLTYFLSLGLGFMFVEILLMQRFTLFLGQPIYSLALILFSRARKLNLLSIGDLAACATPVGLFLGRLANFINGELWGRTTDVSWAMVFPTGGPLPRHPSQLYEAFLEGIVLFSILWIVRRRTDALDRPGELGGWFCAGYGAARFIVEFFRQPDAHLGYILGPFSMGQLLSVPLILFGLYLIRRARTKASAKSGSGAPGA